MSFGDNTDGGCSLWSVFLMRVFGGSGWLGGLEGFLVYLVERRADFLRLTEKVGSAVLGLLVGRWRDWLRS